MLLFGRQYILRILINQFYIGQAVAKEKNWGFNVDIDKKCLSKKKFVVKEIWYYKSVNLEL